MRSSVRRTALAVGMLAAFAATAAPVTAMERLRGRIASIDGDTLAVLSRDGSVMNVALTDRTRITRLVPAQLSDVTAGSFVGTATKSGPDGPIALELRIFPESMRGAGEGHRAWDRLPDTTGGAEVETSMTNGTVGAASGAEVDSMMTNGTVDARRGQDGLPTLTVSYPGGSQTVTVPPTAPIMAVEPGDRSSLIEDASVLVAAETVDGQRKALFLSVGTDVPM